MDISQKAILEEIAKTLKKVRFVYCDLHFNELFICYPGGESHERFSCFLEVRRRSNQQRILTIGVSDSGKAYFINNRCIVDREIPLSDPDFLINIESVVSAFESI